jgi:hypothetical protein
LNLDKDKLLLPGILDSVPSSDQQIDDFALQGIDLLPVPGDHGAPREDRPVF